MQKFLKWIETRLMPPMTKIGMQRHMVAIRNGVISTLSLILIGSFIMVFANFPIPAVAEWLAPHTANLTIPFRITMGLMAIYASFAMGDSLAKSYDLDGVTGGVLSLAAFLTLTIPLNVDTVLTEAGEAAIGWVLPMQYLGGAGMFSAILTMIFAVEIYRFFIKRDITIKMPDGVPPAVGRSFGALLPGGFIIIFLWIVRVMLNFDINAFIMSIFNPIADLMGNNMFGALLPMIFIHLLWAAGVHGMNIIGSIVRPMWLMMLDANMAAMADGTPLTQLPYVAPEQFYQWFVTMGGAGVTLVLVFLLFTCRAKYLRDMAKLTFVPGLFNINEPLIFGMPLMMNPVFTIPFVLNPIILTIVSYSAVRLGLVNGFVANVPWTLPAPIGAYMATGNDWRAIILVLVNLFIAGLIYYPFVKMYDKQMLEEEKKAATETEGA
ncbi:PTS sugar transporter subunit IIC [Lactococcus petauri]|uniref:PTS sugar transporter subunit IIC n=1 Tax=Lactococcus petauri TaxID=1940789 RepID=UPI00031882ED|nr:PTS sugar transporter subunit IIC [Lactococcus petauri]KKF91486.1 PTS lactose transporter subunit IIC [Lactococcus garvieae]MBK4109765.1 PTS sugar transporter subunit IIC [Lactococcus petauri]MDT2552204.1 PTS sugar transporter subunit IIC [Lactococcus petauri]MDT2562634.1 PTS sugar transporter subunit IIC [Lactococcus petauri]MDT2581661.1 PTS sugar transporter subunit IIC [Lactococcus petauri]